MNQHLYLQSFQIARGWGREALSEAIPGWKVAELPVSTGIYITCGFDQLVRYVGSAHRPGVTHGVYRRITEHPVPWQLQWEWFWIIPLKNETPLDLVRAIEGQVIDLLNPPMNRKRHPLKFIPVYRELKRHADSQAA
jgi:hypothetical protein